MKKRTWLILLVALFVLTASLSAAELWLPRGLKTIEEEAFAGDHAIQGVVTLPDGVETVGASAFKDTDLYALVLPESVQQVGSHAVGGEKLVYVTIRGEHTAFAADALEGVRAVIGYHPEGYEGAYEYVSFDDLCRQDGFIYRIEGDHVVIVCPENAAELSGEITIPMQLDNGMAVQGGANCSFAGCWNVTAVHLPVGCEGLMDDGAFDELHEGASVDYYAEMEPLNAYFQPDGVSERMPVGQVFSMKVEIYNAEHPDQYTVSSADESIVAPNGDGTFTAKQVGVTDMVLTDEYGRTTTWMVCVRSLDSKQIIPILGLDYPTDNEGNPMDTLTAGEHIPVCVTMSNGDKLADLRDERTHMEFCIELLDAKGAVLKREDNIQAWNTFTDWTTVTYGFRYSDMDWAEFYAQGAEAVRVTIQAHDDTHETVNHEVDADRSSITLKIIDWNAQEPYITMELSGLLKNGTIDRNRHFYVTLTSHNPEALPENGLEFYVPDCADQQMMTREQPSVTLAVWPSDGREYYEVRAVNHDTDEDYLLSGLNLTCAEELQGDFYAEDIEPRIAVGTTFRMKAELYNAENPENYTIAPRNAEIISDNGDGTFTAIAEGATEMVLTDELGRELTWSIRVHAVGAEQVRPVVYLDYAQDGEGNQRTSVSAMEGLPYRVGLTNAEDMEKIQDAGANIRIRRELLGSDGQVLVTWSDFEAYNHFTNWTESDLEVDMDTFRWSALYARQAAAVRLTLIPQDEGDYSFINYDVDDTRNSITLTIDDWRTDSEFYVQMAVSGLLKNGLAARYTHIQLTLTSLNPEALPESGLHVYVPDYADEQVLTREQPTVTLQVWTDGGAEWFEVKGYAEGTDDDYWFGGFHMEYADDLEADFYGNDTTDRMAIGTTFHMNVEIHNSETPDQYTISVEDDSIIQDNGDGSYTAIGAGVTNMVLTDSIGRQMTWTVRVHEAGAAQVKPVIYLDYLPDESCNLRTTTNAMDGIPCLVGLSNADQQGNIQDEGANIRIHREVLDANGEVLADFGDEERGNSFVNWTESETWLGLSTLEWTEAHELGAKSMRLSLVAWDEQDHSDINYDVDSARNSITLEIADWRMDTELYMRVTLDGLFSNGRAPRDDFFQAMVTCLNPELLPENGLYIAVPEVTLEQHMTRENPSVTLQIWGDDSHGWNEIAGREADTLDWNYWFGGFGVEYEDRYLNAGFCGGDTMQRMPVGNVFHMEAELYNSETPDQYTVTARDNSIIQANEDGSFTAIAPGVTEMVLTDSIGREQTWAIRVHAVDAEQVKPVLYLEQRMRDNVLQTSVDAMDYIYFTVGVKNSDQLANLQDEGANTQIRMEYLDADGQSIGCLHTFYADDSYVDYVRLDFAASFSQTEWAEMYTRGAKAIRLTLLGPDDENGNQINYEVDEGRKSITVNIGDWNAEEPYITMELSGLLKNGTIDRNRHFYVTLTSHNPQALPENGLEFYVPDCADQQMMTREQPSVTLEVWPSDGREYYEVRAVNHDTDEDYLLSGLNLTCAEELQGDFYAEDIEPRIAVGTTFRMKAELYNAENPENYTIAPRNAEIIRDNGDGTFTAIAEGATEMVLTDELGRELTWSIRVHAVDAEQVRPVVYLDYAQDGEGNQRTSISAMEGLPYRVGLTNAEDMEKIQDAGANIRIRRELLGSDGQVLVTWSDFEAYNHFTNWTESDLEVDMDTFRWSALYARQAAAVRLTLIPQDEGDYSFINYDVDDTRNSITLTIDDWRTDSELYLQMAVSGLLKNGLAARYTHIQLTLTSLNPEALPESGLHVYVPDYADEQVLTRDQPTVTLQVWTDGGAEWFEVKGYAEGIDDYWFGGFHMEYADDLEADFYGNDTTDRMAIGTTFHMNVEIHNSEAPDQYTISVEDDSIIRDNGDGSYTAIGAGVTNMLLTDSIGRQTTWTVRVHETDAAQVRPELAITYATNEETGEALTSCKMLGSVPIVIRLSNEDQIANLQDEGSLIRIRSVALNAAGDEVYDFGAFTTSDSFVNWTEHRIRFSLDAQESEAMRQSEAVKIKIMLVPYDEGENSDVNYDIDSSRSSIFLDIVEN